MSRAMAACDVWNALIRIADLPMLMPAGASLPAVPSRSCSHAAADHRGPGRPGGHPAPSRRICLFEFTKAASPGEGSSGE